MSIGFRKLDRDEQCTCEDRDISHDAIGGFGSSVCDQPAVIELGMKGQRKHLCLGHARWLAQTFPQWLANVEKDLAFEAELKRANP